MTEIPPTPKNATNPLQEKKFDWHNLPFAVKLGLQIVGLLVGFAIGAALVFNVLFLMKVIPHGGIL